MKSNKDKSSKIKVGRISSKMMKMKLVRRCKLKDKIN